MKRMNIMAAAVAALAALLVAVPAQSASGGFGYLQTIADTTVVSLVVHVGSASPQRVTASVSGGVSTSMAVVSPRLGRSVAVDTRAVSLSGKPGQSIMLTCPIQVSIASQYSWTLDQTLTNDFHPWDFRAYNLAYRIYDAGQRSVGGFAPFVAYPDNNNQSAPVKRDYGRTHIAKYCVDLRLTIPSNVPNGDYYSAISYVLYTSQMGNRPTPTPTPTVAPTPTPVPAYPDGTYAVLDGNLGKIFLMPANQTGSVSPVATITLPAPNGWNGGNGKMVFDPYGNLWVAYGIFNGYAAIAEYAAPLTDGATPVRLISGAATNLTLPYGISFNPWLDEVIVSDNGTHAILSFSALSDGNVAPLRAITESNGGLSEVESDNSTIYEGSGIASNPGMQEFAITETGFATPAQTVLGPTWASNVGISSWGGPLYFDYDATGNLFVESNTQVIYELLAPISDSTGPSASVVIPSGGDVKTDDISDVYVALGSQINVYGPYTATSIPAAPRLVVTSSAIRDVVAVAVYSPLKLNGPYPR